MPRGPRLDAPGVLHHVKKYSRGMRQLNGIYSQAFNRHYRMGHLFQERFQGILVEKETRLWHCVGMWS